MQVLKAMWNFLQMQVLGMKWLNNLIGKALASFGLNTSSRWTGSIQFFLYDVIKIVVLLCVLIFMISYIQSYFPPERSKKILKRFRGIGANIIAALLGTVTPLFLLFHTAFYWFYFGRFTTWSHFLFLNFFTNGRSGFPYFANEHFWDESRPAICGFWIINCGIRGHSNREKPYGKVC